MQSIAIRTYRIVQIVTAIGAGLFFCAVTALAQVPPDHDALLNGEGSGQGQFAEQNGYPGPKHVLDLAKELNLSESQTKTIRTAFDEMKGRAKELGESIVRIEQELDEAFKNALVTEKSVRDDTEEIGRLRGNLRAVHLVAHIKTKKVLTSAQLAEYKKLRESQGDHKEKK